MPGRCGAGRIFQHHLDGFLRSAGLRQLMTDRRVWTKHDSDGSLIVHDHVDDFRPTATNAVVRNRFHEAWAREFNEAIELRPLSEDFTGRRYTCVCPFTTAISCEGVKTPSSSRRSASSQNKRNFRQRWA